MPDNPHQSTADKFIGDLIDIATADGRQHAAIIMLSHDPAPNPITLRVSVGVTIGPVASVYSEDVTGVDLGLTVAYVVGQVLQRALHAHALICPRPNPTETE